jgi:5-methylcytosine-specific restriction protein A
MSAHLKYWQRNGTRRPLPSLWEAVQAYGRDNVYFDSPKYVDDRYCPWCGKLVTNKRRTYCTDECRQSYANMTVWHRGRGPYSLRILFRDNFTCQDCGEFHAHKNEHGIYVPIDDGQLEVHHILPVSEGGGDEQQNLVTLCKKCHKARHCDSAAQRTAVEVK